jgi:hypothetical protein
MTEEAQRMIEAWARRYGIPYTEWPWLWAKPRKLRSTADIVRDMKGRGK